ncbi:MAG: hypothetical protein GEV07_28035 [Streptosporangiales bacterium]|nr:hypothetical protein [Streptosporangiales bacterium]
MVTTRFSGRRAPCGRSSDGEHYETQDGQGLASDQLLFDCGCKVSRDEFHDGTLEHAVVRHDGKLLEHETIGEHGD